MKDQLPLTILRPPAIYGPRDNEILAFFKTVRQGRGVAFRLGKSLEQVNMIYGPDCAKACVRAIEADVPSGSTFFVDDGQAYSFGDLASAIADACGVPFRGTPSVPVFVLKAAAAASEMYGKIANKAVMFNRDKLNELLIKHFLCETGDAQVKLSWTPEVMFPEGAQLTADWYRKNGWL